MIRALTAAAALLAGCAHSVTLIERGGTQWVGGRLDYASKSLAVQLRGESYSGTFLEATAFEAVPGQRPGRAPGYVSDSGVDNNAAALLAGSRGGALRCVFRVSAFGGYGRCVDGEERAYDLLIE